MRKAGAVLVLGAAMLASGARQARAQGAVVVPNAVGAARAGAASGVVAAAGSLLPSMDFAQSFTKFVQDFFRRDLSLDSDLNKIGYDDVTIMARLRAMGKLENTARSLAELAEQGFVAVIPDTARHLLPDRQAAAPVTAPPPRSAPLKNPFSGDPADFSRPGGPGGTRIARVDAPAGPDPARPVLSGLRGNSGRSTRASEGGADPTFDQARRWASSPAAIP